MALKYRQTFSSLPLVAAKLMPVMARGEYEAFVAPFKAHNKRYPSMPLLIRKFKRTVRAGGCGIEILMVVVRRKAVKETPVSE